MTAQSVANLLLWTLFALSLAVISCPGQFIRPASADASLEWGIRGGIVVGLHPAMTDSLKRVGPRGLLRVGIDAKEGRPLLNFIAVEPVVMGKIGLSELERGGDGQPGKRFRVANRCGQAPAAFGKAVAGRVTGRIGQRMLSFCVHVERFSNGAAPIIEVTLEEQHPLRIRLATYSAKDGAPMERCTLSATMGNLARARVLWLRQETIHTGDYFDGFRGAGFTEREPFPRERLLTLENGDVVAAITSDEIQPREVHPFPDRAWWWPSVALTQYWIKPGGSKSATLCVRVNGRSKYWRSKTGIPGGVAIENFELREDYSAGSAFIFGLARRSPVKALGFPQSDLLGFPRTDRKISSAEAAAISQAGRNSRRLGNGHFKEGLAHWQAEVGSDEFRVFEADGLRRITTFGTQRDADRGRLFQCFVVPDDAVALRFFLHGGCDRRRLRVALWDGKQLHRWMTGRDDNLPFQVDWDLRALRGRTVTLEILDRSTKPWGFIGAHGFEVIAEAASGTPGR